MSGKKDDIRSQRSAAIADKKRRLEELKARRNTRLQADASTSTGSSAGGSTGTSTGASTAVSASKSGNLDEYIDGLLNSALPAGMTMTPFSAPSSASVSSANTAATNATAATEATSITGAGTSTAMSTGTSIGGGTSSQTTTADAAEEVHQPQIETFEMCTQTNENDFPEQDEVDDDDEDEDEVDDDEDNDDKENKKLKGATKKEENNESTNNENDNDDNIKQTTIEPKLLNEEEVSDAISSTKFTSFFNSASKKVERLLGSSILSDLLVDDVMYYTDLQSKRNNNNNNSSSGNSSSSPHSLITAQVTFEYPKWTQGRDVTSIDWSPHHRGEVMLASYHIPNNTNHNSISTAISSILPNATPSSSLLPKSRSEITQADGLNIVWNLTMPNRPEHILTCGSPVLESKFHPTEGNLVVGACYSGQVVVWDVRSGRLPVQRSSLNLLGNSGGGGHVHPVVGMEALDGGAGFVTAASDGTVNFWSLSNLIEPAESLKIPGGNLTSISVAPESQSIIAGDECGSMYAIVSSSTTSSGGGTGGGGVGGSGRSSSSSTSRRTVRKLNDGKKDPGNNNNYNNISNHLSHYGPVTGLSTKLTSKSDTSDGFSISRGFARGTKGMVLTCGVDWTTKLWAPAYSDKPLLNLLSHSYDYMCDVQWSPMHPSVFATASSNGTLNFWNLASSIDEPVTGVGGVAVEKTSDPSSPSPGVNKIKWSADGRRIAAACSDKVHVLGMSEELWKPNGDEEVRLMSNLKSRGLLDEE